jgi:hypothetical protein
MVSRDVELGRRPYLPITATASDDDFLPQAMEAPGKPFTEA